MKLSDLVRVANSALIEHGDIDLCIPCDDESVNEGIVEATEIVIRKFGDPAVPESSWGTHEHRTVFAIG